MPAQGGPRRTDTFEAQPRAVSLTDCIVMAIADEFGTKAIFGFDADHERNGYEILSREKTPDPPR